MAAILDLSSFQMVKIILFCTKFYFTGKFAIKTHINLCYSECIGLLYSFYIRWRKQNELAQLVIKLLAYQYYIVGY